MRATISQKQNNFSSKRIAFGIACSVVLSLLLLFPTKSSVSNTINFSTLFLEGGPKAANDLRIYYTAGYLLNHGLPLYNTQISLKAGVALAQKWGEGGWDGPYLYAPCFAVFMRLLNLLSWPVAQLIWLLTIVLAWMSLLVGTLILARILAKEFVPEIASTNRWVRYLINLISFISLPPILFNQSVAYNIYDGQVNIQLSAILLWAFILIYSSNGHPRSRFNKEAIGGVLIAIAVTTKVFPLLLLIPLFISQKWTAIRSLAITCLFLFGLGIALGGGIGNTWGFFQNLSNYGMRIYWQPNNQSIQGFWARIIGGEPFINYAQNISFPSGSPLLFQLPLLAAILSYATITIILGISLYCILRKDIPIFSWSTLLVLSVIILPKSWVHTHYISVTALLLLWVFSSPLFIVKYSLLGIFASSSLVIVVWLYYVDWMLRAGPQYTQLLAQAPWLWSTYVVAAFCVWITLCVVQWLLVPSKPLILPHSDENSLCIRRITLFLRTQCRGKNIGSSTRLIKRLGIPSILNFRGKKV